MPSGESSLLRKLLIVGSLPALLAASFFYLPRSIDGPVFCVFKLSLGMPCMGCGLTRAFCCLAHGDFIRALQFHFLAPVLVAHIAIWYSIAIVQLFKPIKSPRWFSHFGRWLVIAFALFYAGRMVVFFSAPEGPRSLLLQNGPMRVIRRDLSNTYEPWVPEALRQ